MTFGICDAPAPAGVAMTRADPLPADAGAVAAVKAYLRIETGAEDALIARLASVAMAHGEQFLRRMLIARTVHEDRRADAGWQRLGAGPVSAITGVEALAVDGTTAALAPTAYAIDVDASGDGWVRTIGQNGRVRVTYSAGLAADWSALPDPIAQGVVRLAAHLFTHRDDGGEGAPPAAIAALWRPWRRLGL